MLAVALIAVLMGVASWARGKVPISYESLPTRSGPPQYRAYYADGTFKQDGGKSGRWVKEAKSGRWVIVP